MPRQLTSSYLPEVERDIKAAIKSEKASLELHEQKVIWAEENLNQLLTRDNEMAKNSPGQSLVPEHESALQPDTNSDNRAVDDETATAGGAETVNVPTTGANTVSVTMTGAEATNVTVADAKVKTETANTETANVRTANIEAANAKTADVDTSTVTAANTNATIIERPSVETATVETVDTVFLLQQPGLLHGKRPCRFGSGVRRTTRLEWFRSYRRRHRQT